MKLNKKGFTLVELLAVIAILAILMVIAIPGVLTLFNNGKRNAFITEVQSLAKAAKNEWMGQSMTSAIERIYCNTSDTACANKSIKDLSTKNKYFVRVDSTGKITELYITDEESMSYSVPTASNLMPADIKQTEGTGIFDKYNKKILNVDDGYTVTLGEGSEQQPEEPIYSLDNAIDEVQALYENVKKVADSTSKIYINYESQYYTSDNGYDNIASDEVEVEGVPAGAQFVFETTNSKLIDFCYSNNGIVLSEYKAAGISSFSNKQLQKTVETCTELEGIWLEEEN